MEFSKEILRGAGAISKVVYGANTQQNRRRIYHKHETKQLPTWMEGNQIITTLTALREHYQHKRENSDVTE